jgi:integrase
MKFPTVWSQADIEKIKVSADRISPEGKRSYAMILLAAELGLRIGDIRQLKFSDIDWERKMITIVQHKTQQELCLPLPESVGWALIDYIKNGRPVSNSHYVFVKHRPPYDEFPPTATLNYLLTKVLVKADIPADKKKQFGWHTFRRSLATNLLQNNIPMNTITEILGHNDPETAGQYYVQISTASLKPCILEVEVKDYVQN